MLITLHAHSSASDRALLNDLMQSVFGFRFDRWIERGLWNEDYTCYSLVENGVMLANAAAYRMRLLIEGQERECLQIGAVATRPGEGGKGYSRRVIEFLLAQSGDLPMFLCANPSVVNFYPRFGFRPLHDFQPRLKVTLGAAPGQMRRLSADAPAVSRYVERRGAFSAILDCANAASIQRFNLMYGYDRCIYEIPSLKLMLAAEQDGSLLNLYEVWADQPLPFDALAAHLDFPGVDTIHFGFNPDWLGVTPEWCAYETDSPMFLRGKFPFLENFVLPVLMRT